MIATVLFAAVATTTPDLEDRFLALVREGTPQKRLEFQAHCRKPDPMLSFESRPPTVEGMKEIAKVGGIDRIRGLLYALQRCSDGASALGLRCYLGNELLLAQPAALLGALAEEKLSTIEIAKIVGCEPEAFFAVDCRSAKCKADKRKAFEEKKAALRRAVIPPTLESTREKVLEAFVD